MAITTQLTGAVNAVHVSRGELIRSGQKLLVLRLTHQDLVKTQEAFLHSLGQVDFEQREIARLTSIARSGAVAANEPGKEVLYPVATVIIGGLLTSTFAEFFVRPALFWIFSRPSGVQALDARQNRLIADN